MYRLQASTTCRSTSTTDRCHCSCNRNIDYDSRYQGCVHQLLKLSKERMSVTSTRTAPLLQPGDLVYLSTKGLHIRSQKCPIIVICKVDINSYNFYHLSDFDYILCFIVTSYPLRFIAGIVMASLGRNIIRRPRRVCNLLYF